MKFYSKSAITLMCTTLLTACAHTAPQNTNVLGLCAELKIPCVENHIAAVIDQPEHQQAVLKAASETLSVHKQYFSESAPPVVFIKSQESSGPRREVQTVRPDLKTVLATPSGPKAQQLEMVKFILGLRWFQHNYLMTNVETESGTRSSSLPYPIWFKFVIDSIHRDAPLNGTTWGTPIGNYVGTISPLERYFSVEHPSYKTSTNQSMAIFYKQLGYQSNLFAQFLIATSEDKKVFHHFARDKASDFSMADWLASQQRYTTLPDTITELEVLWQEWVKTKKM